MNSIKIYYINCDFLSDSEEFRRAYSAASDYRKGKTDKLKQEADKLLSLGADILMKKALGQYADMPVTLGEFGKPRIEGCPYNFSLSHSGSIAMLAVSKAEVGCDVQTIGEAQPKGVAKRFFTAGENEILSNSDSPDKMFFRLWTIKESYIKAKGAGMSIPLDSFEVSLKNEKPFIDGECTVKELALESGYCAAVCVLGEAEIEEVIEIIKPHG